MTERKPSFIGPLLPVLLTVLVDLLGFGIIIPNLSYYARAYGASPIRVTELMAVYSVAQFVFQPMWGLLSDRVGRRPVMITSIAGTMTFLALFARGGSLPLLFLWRFLNGAFAANISTAQAYVADVTTPEDRAKGMGLIGASFGFGFTFGPVIGGFLGTRWGYAAPIWFAAALSAINLVQTVVRLPESRKIGSSAAERTIDPRALLEALSHPVVGLAIALTFAVTFAFSMMETSFPIVAQDAWKLDSEGVGYLLGLIGIVGIVVQGGLIGRLTKRFGEPVLVIVGVTCNAVGLAGLSAAAMGYSPSLGRWVACTLLALGTSLTNPSLSSLVSRGVGKDEQGSILGANQSLSALARATAPTVGGYFLEKWFLGGAFLAGSLMLLASLPLAIPAVRRARAGRV